MKETGFRKMDDLGRVTVPAELREKYDLKEHNIVDFIPKKDGILLRKIYNDCIFCGSKENLIKYNEKNICLNCRKALQ